MVDGIAPNLASTLASLRRLESRIHYAIQAADGEKGKDEAPRKPATPAPESEDSFEENFEAAELPLPPGPLDFRA